MSDSTTQKFLEEFAPNMTKRLERLEAFAERVDCFLFKDEPGKPSLATVAYAVHRHVEVWCAYARGASRFVAVVARFCKRLLVILAAAGAAAAALAAAAHFFGFDLAQAQAQARALKEDGTFRQYVSSFAGSPQLGHFGVLLGFGLAGVLANWFWKWTTDQIKGSLLHYLVRDTPKRTLASVCCIAGWALWATDPALTWTQTINLALTTGFAIDVLVNKATRAEWTPEERATKTGG